MAKKTVSQLRTEARNRELMRLMEFVRNDGEDASQYDGNAFSYPIVYEDGTESWVQVKISIPTGTRDGKQFDTTQDLWKQLSPSPMKKRSLVLCK